MARLILPVAGAVIGSFFGPAGTSIGFALGSVASSLLFPVKQSDPKPLDTKWTGVEYGTPVPWFIGQMRLSAIPVYLSDKSYVAQTTEAGKGGDSVTTGYEYYADAMFLIADNESAALLDVIKAGRRAWTARSDASAAQLEASAASEDWEEIRFYGGADDQLPDPDYEADVGVGFAPAYIGRTTVFIKRLRLDGGAQLPQLHFIAATDADPAGSDEVILFRFDADDSEVGGRTVTVTGSPVFGSATTVFGGAGEFSGSEYVTVPVTMGSPGELPITLECWFQQTSSMNSTDINVIMELQPTLGGSNYLRLGWRTNGFQFISDTGEGIEYLYGGSAPIGTWVFVRACFRPSDGQMWLFVNGLLVASGTVPALIGGAGPGAHVVRVGQRSIPNNGTAVAIIDDARVTIGRLRSTAAFGVPPSPLPYDPLATVTPNELDLADVVTALHARAGHDASLIDVSALVGTEVHGVIAGQVQPVRGVLQQLAQGYYFERVPSGGVMKYVDRGGASIVTIPFGDMGVGEDSAAAEPLKIERGSDLEVPNEWTVEFVSRRGRRYETGAQHSSRVATEAAGAQKVSLGIAFREAQARGRAQSFALDAAVARTTFEFSVGLAYAYLEPTDVVTLTARSGTTFRARILEVSEARGILQCSAVLDDPYALRAEGAAAVDDEAVQDIALPADTNMVLLDIAPLRDSEAQSAGHMVAATGTGTWPGASIRRSIDGADFTEQAALVLERAVVGTTTTVLDADPPLHREHLCGTLGVRVLGTLASSTRAAMQQDRTINVLAVETSDGEWELLRYRTATLTGTEGDYNLYTLTGLQRGRRGTEPLVGLHAVGTRVVLMRTSGLRNVSTEVADIGLERSFRGVTLGRSLSSASTVAFTNECRRFNPWAPASLRVARDGSGNATITLQPRTRLLGRYGGSGGSVLTASDADDFEIDVYADDTYAAVLRTLSGVQAGIAYSAAQQASDGLTPGDLLYLRAHQVSTTVGRGYALEAAA